MTDEMKKKMGEMDLENRLKEIKERCEAATEGPWRQENNFYGGEVGPFGPAFSVYHNDWCADNVKHDSNSCVLSENFYKCEKEFGDQAMNDLLFTAHARTDVPMLLEMVEVMLAELEGVKRTFKLGLYDPNEKLEKIAERYK